MMRLLSLVEKNCTSERSFARHGPRLGVKASDRWRWRRPVTIKNSCVGIASMMAWELPVLLYWRLQVLQLG